MRTFTWKNAEGRFCISFSGVESGQFFAADSLEEAQAVQEFASEAYQLGRQSMAADLRRLLDERHGAPT